MRMRVRTAILVCMGILDCVLIYKLAFNIHVSAFAILPLVETIPIGVAGHLTANAKQQALISSNGSQDRSVLQIFSL